MSAPELMRHFALPVGLLSGGVVSSLLDRAYAGSTGEMLSLGPVRLTWIAAVMVVAGIILLVLRAVTSRG